MARSRYDLFRRRIAPVAFVLALVLLGWQTCSKRERVHATIVFDLGSRSRDVIALDADVKVGDEVIAHFHRTRGPGVSMGRPSFDAVLTAKEADLELKISLPERLVETRRRIVADEGSTITVSLGDELDGR